MDATDAGPEASAAPEPSTPTTYLRWPPPGLERLQGDVWKIVREFFVGGLILVLPLLWAVGETQPFHSAGPFGEAWWIVLLTTAAGLMVLVTSCINAFRLLRRAANATDGGYGWKTVALVAVDADRDTGFLLQAGRAFSVLSPPTRHSLAHARLWAAGTWLAAALWLPVGFILAVLLSSRGAMSAPVLVLFTLLPMGFLLVMGLIFKSWERGVLRKARKEWHDKPWSQDLERSEITDWHDDLGRRDATEHLKGGRSSRSGWVLRASAYAVVVVAAFVVVPSVTLVVSSSVSPILSLIAVPRFSRTQQRAARVEALWRYRVPADGTVTPQEAGEILHVLESLFSRAGDDPIVRPPVRTYDRELYPDSMVQNNPTGMPPGTWSEEIFAALDTLGPNAVDHLREVGSHPALQEISTLARAEALDAAGARWITPFPDDMNAASFPIPRMAGLREAAYIAVGRAAASLADGRPGEAEQTLREVITFGLLLGRDGTTLIDNLVGYVVAETGAEALAGFYRAVGRTDEAQTVEWTM
ncbi:MAG TPA: hypothetical protein VGA70_11865, partial [Longimicrobiales bacterium]